MKDITRVQKRVYYIIKDFIDEKGYSPTFREIAEANGNNSVSTVVSHLRALRKKGYVDYIDKASRTVRITKEV